MCDPRDPLVLARCMAVVVAVGGWERRGRGEILEMGMGSVLALMNRCGSAGHMNWAMNVGMISS